MAAEELDIAGDDLGHAAERHADRMAASAQPLSFIACVSRPHPRSRWKEAHAT
jgi:hypothetical protein